MTILSRIFAGMLCFAPFAGALADGPLATTAGSNLTAFNPSTAYNNQWATMSNGRAGAATGAKADFGNCNALISRCATPKCANGGCSDMNVAAAIVAGCVQSNKSCVQYGNDLVSYMAAQLVANSNAKINAQQAQIAQQKSEESQQQMQQMQQQMYQMQQQMAQQNAESQRQLQEALAQQQAQMAAQQAAALEQVSAAAKEAAKKTEAGISEYQEAAISRGASEDVLVRQQITGQIMTEIEDAVQSLKDVKNAMNEAFEYAGCDSRGNDCTGPKRVARWREKARGFIDPYNNSVEKMYTALKTAQMVGADISEIYMMLSDSCNQWAEYMCEKGATIIYPEEGVPQSCPDQAKARQDCIATCNYTIDARPSIFSPSNSFSQQSVLNLPGWATTNNVPYTMTVKYDKECEEKCNKQSGCRPCRFLRPIDDQEEVYKGWVDPSVSDKDNGTVIACGSGILERNKIMGGVARRQKGKSIIDINSLDIWMGAKESNNPRRNPDSFEKDTKERCYKEYQSGKDMISILQAKILNKTLPMGELCVTANGDVQNIEPEECEHINAIYAICDTHVYNIGKPNNPIDSDERAEMKEVIGLKTTVISQQMYKQYEYLNATLRRLRAQLEKSVLMANLEAAGAKSDSDGSSSSRRDKDSEVFLKGAENCWNLSSEESVYSCIQQNANLIKSSVGNNKKAACKQLVQVVKVADSWLLDNNGAVMVKNCDKYKSDDSCSGADKADMVSCTNSLNVAVGRARSANSNKKSGIYLVQ